MNKIILAITAPLLSLILVACSTPVSTDVLKSSKARDLSPSGTNLTQLVDGNSDFAFDLYQTLKAQNDGNLFYSPYSLSLAIAMAYAGARGDTATQTANTLHFTLPQGALDAAFNYLTLSLDSRGKTSGSLTAGQGEPFQLSVVNDAWGQKNFSFLSSYLDTLAINYGAGLRVLDFTNDAEGARQSINQYISDKTQGKIKDLIPQGAVTDLTRLVLTNAIYFKATWQTQFTKEATGDGTFNLLDGGKVTVQMMNQTSYYKYFAGEGFQALELPYDGGQMSMDVFLPDAGQFNNFQSALDSTSANTIIGSMTRQDIILSLPKFQFSSNFSLKQTLSSMGMAVAFSDISDFSGMTGTPGLQISDIVHKAFVSVDEAGTEAAAASAVIMVGTAMPANQVTLSIDRPFIFMIRDIPTGSILFIGRVLNPVA